MSKKLLLVFIGVIFFSGFSLARAEVVINEVAWMGTAASQYEEWIELKNTSSESVPLLDWKLYKNNGTLLFSLSKTISADGYLLICRTTASVANPLSGICDEQGTFGGSGLNNTSDLVQLKDASDIQVDLVDGTGVDSWSAGNNDTKETMQKSDSGWITASPTPKAQNPSSSSSTGSGSSSSSSTSDEVETEPEVGQTVTANSTMKAKILTKTLAFTGEPLEIKTNIFGYLNEDVVLGRAYWNFGDGGSLEQIDNFEKFYHTYYYPGEYALLLEYYPKSYSKTPEVVSKTIIKVLSTTVTISKVGDAKDFFIELSNNASSDIDISNWVISANGKTFILPKNSVILSKKQMIISGRITGFVFGDQSNLRLFSSTGELVFNYSSPIEVVKILVKNPVPVKISTVVEMPEVVPTSEEQISKEDLSASALSSDVLREENESPYSLPIIPIVSFVFIGASAGVVYFIRRKKIVPKTGEDFEILDE